MGIFGKESIIHTPIRNNHVDEVGLSIADVVGILDQMPKKRFILKSTGSLYALSEDGETLIAFSGGMYAFETMSDEAIDDLIRRQQR